jgi:hypothetical protein
MRKVMIAGAMLIALVCGSSAAVGATHSSHSTKLVSAKKMTGKHAKKHAGKIHHKHKAKSHSAK